MIVDRISLSRQCLEKSLEVRDEHGYDFRSPLCVYELAHKMGVTVRFTNEISMEGFYAALDRPTIVLSALRPLARRVYTCAHELGHYVFGHGSALDELCDEEGSRGLSRNELLADTFAGFLLMPSQAVRRAFACRNWDVRDPSPEQVFRIACSFGVGYETLLAHMSHSLRLLSIARAKDLTKTRLPVIRQRLLGISSNDPLIAVDSQHAMPTVDAEVGTTLLLPHGVRVDSQVIVHTGNTPAGNVFRAANPGLCRLVLQDCGWAVVARVSRYQYAGLARYRHLEEIDSE